MNEHILLVMKWLDDPESVSQEERENNKEEARDAPSEVSAYFDTIYSAAAYAAINSLVGASYWLDRYFEETGEDRQAYLGKLKQQ